MLSNQRRMFSIINFFLGIFLLLLFCRGHKAEKRQIPRYSCFYFQHFLGNCIIAKQNRSVSTQNVRQKGCSDFLFLQMALSAVLFSCAEPLKQSCSIYQGCVLMTSSLKTRTVSLWDRHCVEKEARLHTALCGWLVTARSQCSAFASPLSQC